MMTRLAKEARQKRNEEQKFEKKGGHYRVSLLHRIGMKTLLPTTIYEAFSYYFYNQS